MKKVVLFCLIICAFAFIGCTKNKALDSSGIHNALTSSVTSSKPLKIMSSDTTFSAIWKSLGKNKYDVHIIYGFPGILNTANNPKATYNHVETFLSKAVTYTKSVPKSDNYIEKAGYIGPAYITFSNKAHTVTITPTWYVKVKNNTISTKFVTGVLRITFDKQSILIESQAFYNWLTENKWKTSFHN